MIFTGCSEGVDGRVDGYDVGPGEVVRKSTGVPGTGIGAGGGGSAEPRVGLEFAQSFRAHYGKELGAAHGLKGRIELGVRGRSR